MPKPVLIDRWILAFLDPKIRPPADAERLARNRSMLKRRVLATVRSVLNGIPDLRSVRITLNPLPPFGG